MNLKEIKEMLQLMAEHGLSEIEIEKDGLKIRLKKGANGKLTTEEMPLSSGVIPVPRPVEGIPVPMAVSASQESSNVAVVKSPMVGTFYAAPSPDQPAYGIIGKTVREGDVLCIVEAMKLMNEIKAEVSGKILE